MSNYRRKKYRFERRVPILNWLIIIVFGALMLLPLIYSISTSLKPMDELWQFPPRFFVRNPSLKNYMDLLNILNNSLVPFSRYIFNTVFVSIVGTVGHVLLSSMCAYCLAKFKFKGRNFIFAIIVYTLMFNAAVTGVPMFIVMKYTGIINTISAYIFPSFAAPLGLYLMKQFMEQMVNDSVLEAAQIDGASQLQTFFKVVMPTVKPAWLTLIVFSFQGLWNLGGNSVVYSEQLKTFNYALGQILAGGIARAGAAAAASVIMMAVPILVFVLTQSNVVQTMSASGMKD